MVWHEATLWTIFGVCLAIGCRQFIEWVTYINNPD